MQLINTLKNSNKLHTLLLVVCCSFIIVRLWPHDPLSSYAPSSTAVLAADGSLLRLTLASDEQYRLWIPLKDISPTLIDAVKLQVDQWFYWHIGVNPLSISRGAWQTYSGNNQQGGSTLTMQLARLLYQLNTRSPSGKIKQVALALWLEARYSKHDILEAYLNLAPYGRNIQGVGAASLIYFGKTADKLTLPEALTLTVIPQKPNNRASSTNSLLEAKLRLFARWQSHHQVSASNKRCMALPLPLKDLPDLPFAAPHFVDKVLVDSVLAEYVTTSQIKTTLQPRLQALLNRKIKQYIAQNSARGIKNAMAMMIDTRTQAVVALQGSADFNNVKIDGQVNGTLGKHSPGSTLKPFIYGMALDQGLIHPLSILRDAPTAFGPFQPENFDGRFVGPVTAREALIRSRNIPAVDVASKLKNPSLYDFMKAAGVSKLQAEEHYGLALVLGGGEVSMEELATMYTMLANQGELKPLRYLESATQTEPPLKLMSPEASYLVLDMLSTNPRPDGIPTASGRRWSTMWKTGTSWGFRDAWTVGVTGPYVLAVWIGNFDGSTNPAFVGIEAAAPLFFRIADALPLTMPNEPEPVRIPPRNLKRVSVCAASGDLPNAYCPQLADTWFIPGKSPIKVSTLHRPVVIDNRTGLAACPPYNPANTHTEIFEFWDSSMMRLFREAGMPRRVPPTAHCGESASNSQDDAPRITSPLTSVTYTLRLSRPAETIALQATASGDSHTLYWFLDKDYLGNVETKSGGKPWRPATSGWHNLNVVDDQGRSASRDIKIEIVP